MGFLPADCYDDDGNVIEDCLERLREEESWRDPTKPKRHSRFRTKFEEDEYNAGEAKWGRHHFSEEERRRGKRDDAFKGKGFGQASPLQRKKPPHGGAAGKLQQDRRTADIIRRRKII